MSDFRDDSGNIMGTQEREWPNNQRQYRDEAAEWLAKAVNDMRNNEHGEAMYSMFMALRWLEKAGAQTEPMSIETIKLFKNFGK